MLPGTIESRRTTGHLADSIATLDVGDRNANRSWPGLPGSVPLVRAFVDGLLGRRHPSCEAVRLLVTELATNAIVHTRSGAPDGRIHLSVHCSRVRIRVAVRDEGGETAPHLQQPGPESTHGRGLALVAFVADRWGHDPDASTVWFEVDHETPA